MDPAEVVEMTARAQQRAMNEVIDRGYSDIQLFYSDATVFVTGGSGFLGKLLIEKLLRSCDIKKMFILMRSKKGKSTQKRLVEMLADPVYDVLREKKPHFADKLVLVEGDVAEIRLGVSEQDWTTLTREVEVMFHVAATTRFDESLRTATLINVRGTREVLCLAKNCKNIKTFVHVSTAYSHATKEMINSDLMEQFYPCPIMPDIMIQMAEGMNMDRLDAITPQLIDGWPNTYTFTKAIAEEVIRTMTDDLPACIVRPPIVMNTAYEPAPGWLDMSCMYGAAGLFLGVGMGMVHTALMKRSVNIPLVPADYVNNATISAGWDAVMRHNEGDKETKIYCVSTSRSRLTFRELQLLIIESVTKLPDGVRETKMHAFISEIMRSNAVRKIAPPKAVWYCYLLEVESVMLYRILFWLLHYIPAYIVDVACFLLRVKKPHGIPSFVQVYSKVYKISSVLSYFLTNNWNFCDDNMKTLYGKMSKEDKAIYNCDVTNIDWKLNVHSLCIGIRKYIIKDGLQGSVYAYKKQKVFRVLNYLLAVIFFGVIYMIVSLIYPFIKCIF